jgi:hypothetical protein
LPTIHDGLYSTPGLNFLKAEIRKKSHSHLGIEVERETLHGLKECNESGDGDNFQFSKSGTRHNLKTIIHLLEPPLGSFD